MTAPLDRSGRLALRAGPLRAGHQSAAPRSCCGEMAPGLQARGWEVEILTTCALDHYTWANDLPAGTAVEDGLRCAASRW